MSKNSTVISVSIDREQAMFLDDQSLSASALIQEKIEEQKRLFEQFNNKNGMLVKNVQSLQEEIGIIHHFLDEIGKFDDFRKWRGSYVLEK
jgi:hypothetical protein